MKFIKHALSPVVLLIALPLLTFAAIIGSTLDIGSSNSHPSSGLGYNGTIGTANSVVDAESSLTVGSYNEIYRVPGQTLIDSGLVLGTGNTIGKVGSSARSGVLGFSNWVRSESGIAIGTGHYIEANGKGTVIAGSNGTALYTTDPTLALSFGVAISSSTVGLPQPLEVYRDGTVLFRGIQQEIGSGGIWPPWLSGIMNNGASFPADLLNVKISSSIVNIGQLKNVAAAAKAQFDLHTPGDAGPTIDNLIASWPTGSHPENYSPCNIGQLKAVATPFYDRYRVAVDQVRIYSKELDYSNNSLGYPWTEDTTDDSNYSPATMSDLWRVFRFNPSNHDGDGDGLPFWWESYRAFISDSSNVGINGPGGDSDCDGWTNLQEYQNSLNPRRYDPGIAYALQDVLVVYNSSDTNSVDVKDYYISHRPGFQQVATKAVTTSVAESSMTSSAFSSQVLVPVTQEIVDRKNNGIATKFVVLCFGIPTRGDQGQSFAYSLYSHLRNQTSLLCPPLVTYITGALKADVCGYIDRISIGILETDGVRLRNPAAGSVNFILDEFNDLHPSDGFFHAHRDRLLGSGVSSSNIFFRDFDELNPSHNFLTGNNVSGYCSWGHYNSSLGGDFVANGKVNCTGNCWYIMTTAESYNGILNFGSHSDWGEWFSSGAFTTSSGYANVPLGAVSHTEEPTLGGVIGTDYFRDWSVGGPFALCAWNNRRTDFFLPIGDPLVKR